MRLFAARCLAAVALLALAASAPAQSDAPALFERTFAFDVDAQLVSTAVLQIAKQAGIQVAMAGDSLHEFYTVGVRGNVSLREALTRVLQGTGFDFVQTGASTVTIQARPVSTAPAASPSTPMPAPDVTQSEPPAPAPTPAAEPQPEQGIPPVAEAAAEPARSAATTADATYLDTILVTAGKREQDLRAVAASVSALTGDQLEKAGAQSFEDYLKLVPGVTMNKLEADKGAPIIRGIAADTLPGIGSRTTGIFVDDIPLNDLFLVSANIDMNPFDLDRVEIMKGPQGTLFGSSAIAGAVRYITHKPEMNLWQAKLLGTYTTTEDGARPLGAAMVNLPIGDAAAVRAVGLVRETPGYIDDIGRGLEDVGEVEQSTYRVLGTWQPLEAFSLTATWLAQSTYADDAEFADQQEKLERSNTNGPNTRESEFGVANLVGSYDFAWGTLLSSTSHVTKDNFSDINADRGLPSGGGTEQEILNAYGRAATTGLVQELRLSAPDDGSWHWLAGLAYQRYDSFNTGNNSGPFNPPVGSEDVSIGYSRFDAVASESAAFADVTVTPWDDWELTVGGRYFETELEADTLVRGITQLTAQRTEYRSHLTMDDSGFNPKLAARYAISPNVALYALVARGFQFGGVQLAPPNEANEVLIAQLGGPEFKPYKSSTLWNHELGVRTEWYSGRLQFDATMFHMIWKDLQLAQLVVSQGRAITSVYTNVGEARSSGAELAFRIAPARGLSVLTAASFIDAATAVPLQTSSGNYPAGTQLPGAARFQLATTFAYEKSFSRFGEWKAGTSLTFAKTGRMYNDLSHTAEYGNYSTVDCAMRLTNLDLQWEPELSFAVANLLDTRGVTGIGTCSGCPFADVYFVRPLTSVLSLTVRF